MENFISDLSQIEKILRIIPQDLSQETPSDERCSSNQSQNLTALEMMVPHIGRHLEQAERILKGGRLAKEAQVENPEIYFSIARSEKDRVNSAGKTG